MAEQEEHDGAGAALMAERAWRADIIMFDAAGHVAERWRYRSAEGCWEDVREGSMPLAEMLVALEQLWRTSPRMARCTVGDWPTPDGLHYDAPSWLMEAEYESRKPSPEERLLERITSDMQRAWASWDFPDEVGVLTTDDYDATMAMIGTLLSRADAPQRSAA